MFKVLQAFVPFLDQERYDLVRFFEFFLSKSPQKATAALTEVQDKLALSSYKLQETILAVQSICDELPELQLSQSKNKYLTLSGLDTLKLKKIILHEAKDSLRFKIFVHISLNPAGWSDTEFQKKCGINRSTYFRIKCSLLTDLGSKKTTMLVWCPARLIVATTFTVFYTISLSLILLNTVLEKRRLPRASIT